MKKKVGLIIGSLRKASFNRKIAVAVKKIFPKNYEAEIIEIKDLPLYNQDIPLSDVPEYRRFISEAQSCDGFIFFTPEYNRSYTPAIKNAIDIASRVKEDPPFNGKAAAIVSASPGAMGGVNANLALRNTFIYLDTYIMQQPEAYISNVTERFDEDGDLKKDTKEYLENFVLAFIKHLERFA